MLLTCIGQLLKGCFSMWRFRVVQRWSLHSLCVQPLTLCSSLAESTCKPSWSSRRLRALLETPQSLGASRWTQHELVFKICCCFCVHWGVWETLKLKLYNSYTFFKYCACQLYQLLCGCLIFHPLLVRMIQVPKRTDLRRLKHLQGMTCSTTHGLWVTYPWQLVADQTCKGVQNDPRYCAGDPNPAWYVDYVEVYLEYVPTARSCAQNSILYWLSRLMWANCLS